MEYINLVTSPFGIGEKLIFELLKRGESVYTIFPSAKEVPMSFIGKTNLKYGFVRFDEDLYFDKSLPRRIKHVFHVFEVYNGPFLKLFKCNTLATLLLLDWAKRVGAQTFIYLSSGEVYGKGKNVDEKSSLNPHSFYATTKFEAERLLKFYEKSYSVQMARLFFPFGKNVNHGYIADIMQSIASGGGIDTVYKMIAPTFIDDSIEPLVKLRDVKGNETFNMCGSTVEVNKLMDEIQKLSGKSSAKVTAGTIELSGNNTRAQEMLGYREAPVEEALKRAFGR
jgi:nucleoside-diphosphate-sugar epimerase